MDLVVLVPTLPRPGETIRGGDMELHPGGKGANQAVAAARMGAQVAMLGRIGSDAYGEAMRALLEESAVDTRGVLDTPDAPTGVALIGVEASGQNSIIVAPGANLRVAPEDLETMADLLTGARLAVLNFELNIGLVYQAAQRLKAHGARIVLNLAPAFPPPAGLLDLVDVLVVNETEAEVLLGAQSEPGEAVARLLTLGPLAAVLTVGEHGAWFAEGGMVVHLPGYPVKVLDTTAAGDAFVGALAAALAGGDTVPEACRLGNAAGALAVTHAGAMDSLPSAEQVRQFLSEVDTATDGGSDHHRH